MHGTLAPGALFNERYEIVRLVNQGGMGAVYEVVHRETRRRRALKLMLSDLLADADMRARFLREAQVTAEIQSENLVETFDAGIDRQTEQPFLVMELLQGEDLERKLARGPLPAEDVIVYLSQVARGLDKTHQANIIHRDLKPENIFVSTREDGSPLVKLLDFGIAKVLSESARAKSTRSIGTPLYMAPEMLGRRTMITGAVDRYALGHIAYSLLVGEAYFETEGRDTETLYALMPLIGAGITERPSVRALRRGIGLGPLFDAWFARAAAKEPSARFANAKEQIAELATVIAREPPSRLAELSTEREPSPRTISTAETIARPAESHLAPVVAGSRSAQAGTLASLTTGGSAAPRTKDFTVEVESPRARRETSRTAPWLIGGALVTIAAAGLAWRLFPKDAPTSSGLVADTAPLPAASSGAPEPERPVTGAPSSPPVIVTAVETAEPSAAAPTSSASARPTTRPPIGTPNLPKGPDCNAEPWRCR